MGDINLVTVPSMTYEDAIWLAGHGGLKFCGHWRGAVEVVERAIADHDATDLKWAIVDSDDAFLLLLNKTYALGSLGSCREASEASGWDHVRKRWEKVESVTNTRVRRDDRATWSREAVAETTFQAWSAWHASTKEQLAWHQDGGSVVHLFWLELMLFAVREDPTALRYIPNECISEAMVQSALAADPMTLQLVPAAAQSRFRALVFAAVVAEPAALEHVHSKLKMEAVAHVKKSGAEVDVKHAEQRFTTDTGLIFVYS